MMMSSDEAFLSWLETLRARELERLTFQEIRKGVVALSRIYVEERGRLGNVSRQRRRSDPSLSDPNARRTEASPS